VQKTAAGKQKMTAILQKRAALKKRAAQHETNMDITSAHFEPAAQNSQHTPDAHFAPEVQNSAKNEK